MQSKSTFDFLYKGIAYKSYIASSLMHIANLYLLKGDFQRADKEFKACLQYESSFLDSDLAELYYKIGTFHIRV